MQVIRVIDHEDSSVRDTQPASATKTVTYKTVYFVNKIFHTHQETYREGMMKGSVLSSRVPALETRSRFERGWYVACHTPERPVQRLTLPNGVQDV